VIVCVGRSMGMEVERECVPFPLDHFFFCFLPAEAAAGACHIRHKQNFCIPLEYEYNYHLVRIMCEWCLLL